MTITQKINLKQFLDTEKLLYISFALAFLCMPFGIALPTIFVVFALLVWIFSGKILGFFRRSWQLSWMWPVYFLILITWVGLLYSPDPSITGYRYAQKTHYWLYCMVLSTIAFKRFPVEKIFEAFIWGLGINAVLGILQAVGIAPLVADDFTGFGLGYRKLSAYLIIGILYLSYRFGSSAKGKKKLYAAMMVLFFIHLILLKSRTGYYTFVLLLPFIVQSAFKRTSIVKNLLISLILLGLMSTSPVVRNRVALTVEQVKYHLTVDPNESWGKVYTTHQNRFYMWNGAVNIFLEHPLFGVGTGGYSVVLKERGQPDWPILKHPHNDFLYMAVSFGLVGIISYLWLYIEIIKNAWPNRFTPRGNFIFSTALVFIISGMTNGQILDAGMIMLLSLVVGMQNGLPQFEGRLSK